MEGQSGQKWLKSGKSLAKFVRRMGDLFTFESLNKGFNDTLEACRGTDAILYTVLGAAGYHVAERLKVPSLFLLLQPFSRSRMVPSLFAPALPLGGLYNWWTNIFAEQLLWQMVRVPINRWRRETLNLAPVPFSGPFDLLFQKQEPYIYGFSQYVVPRAQDWPSWHHITGYWFLESEQDWSPPPDLVRFIAGGTKPICIGFGSMSGQVTRQLTIHAVDAVMMSSQRAVLVGGWAAAHNLELPDSIYTIESIPHNWLFPRMAAVVHHGGAGTTAAGLLAGVPSIIIPFFGDQHYWGQRVINLRVGPKPISRSVLTAKRLADAISQAITDQAMQNRATALSEKIQAENGVAEAVDLINQHIERSQGL
jgi:UDP:flavonoid glycosyltransferase YjiC (YdhE family)